MKKWFLYFLICAIPLTGCEDVIEVDTPSEDPRLVVEGLLRVDTTQRWIPVEIKLTQTSNFFGTIEPVTDVDEIIIISQEIDENGLPNGGTGTSSLTQLDPGSGIYVPDPSFDRDQRIPVSAVLEANIEFTLVISWRGRRYAAQTRYVPAVPIDTLVQGDKTLFEDEETEVIVRFTDDEEPGQYYLFDFGFANFLPSEDTFYNGQQFTFSYFYDEIFIPGTALEISILGADQTFYNYMDLLVEQTDGAQGPFQTPVATARGNVFDVTNLDNDEVVDNAAQPNTFGLGYFAIVQEFKSTLIIE
ncbi:DUF4249 family protein [Robiginitalea aurantiaca]|uniref:DUF4249 family protein n=1 Tax=Robiginitalea aurantiaca TaxID=3056915 RepID=A0ABT7WIH7_9FLAO|nr:DUF4249 family protein [Robiginitalea aurantiaca]MDM9632634.1 DUF4249 family protein [Robiginitalea aurantiaca]